MGQCSVLFHKRFLRTNEGERYEMHESSSRPVTSLRWHLDVSSEAVSHLAHLGMHRHINEKLFRKEYQYTVSVDGGLITGKVISWIFIYLITGAVIQSGEPDGQSVCRWQINKEELPSPVWQWHSTSFHNLDCQRTVYSRRVVQRI